MNIIEQTEEFSDWLRSLKDVRGKVVYLLLCGGDKSTQEKDIARARKMFGA